MSVNRVFRWGIHELVGHEEASSVFCGEFRMLNGCIREVSHCKSDLYGHNFAGKGAFQNVFMRCYSPRCRICFRDGWAKREAVRGGARLLEASKRFGLVEHGTASPCAGDSDRLLKMSVSEFKAYWKVVRGVLERRGIVGGNITFHPVRYRPYGGWYWSPHFHFLGFVVPSYGRCRRCEDKVCRGRNGEFSRCDGFEAVTRCEREKDGFIVKVFAKRGKVWKRFVMDGELVSVLSDDDNVVGTLKYELSHAGLIVGSQRACVVHWFGVCSYRRLKVTVEKRKQLCPICDGNFVKLVKLRDDAPRPVGSRVYIFDLYGSDGKPYYAEDSSVGYVRFGER